MPRPVPPPSLSNVNVEPFTLEARDQRRIAGSLGLETLSPDVANEIAHTIACFKATEYSNRDTTVGNTLAALAELHRGGRSYSKAVAGFASDRSGVDHTTLGRLQPLARAVLSGDMQARRALAEAAEARAAELRNHPRVAPETEALRFFCGILRLIFDAAATPSIDRTWRNRGRFALEVLVVAGIDHADFDAHPERLREYLATDVTSE